jgi:hypothetical protein
MTITWVQNSASAIRFDSLSMTYAKNARQLPAKPEIGLVEYQRSPERIERVKDRGNRRCPAGEERLVADRADGKQRAGLPVPKSPRKQRYGKSLKAS